MFVARMQVVDGGVEFGIERLDLGAQSQILPEQQGVDRGEDEN
jgi:hypothetical protein